MWFLASPPFIVRGFAICELLLVWLRFLSCPPSFSAARAIAPVLQGCLHAVSSLSPLMQIRKLLPFLSQPLLVLVSHEECYHCLKQNTLWGSELLGSCFELLYCNHEGFVGSRRDSSWGTHALPGVISPWNRATLPSCLYQSSSVWGEEEQNTEPDCVPFPSGPASAQQIIVEKSWALEVMFPSWPCPLFVLITQVD